MIGLHSVLPCRTQSYYRVASRNFLLFLDILARELRCWATRPVAPASLVVECEQRVAGAVEAWWNTSAKSEVACTNECLKLAHVLSSKLLFLVKLARRPLENTSGSQIGHLGATAACYFHTPPYDFVSTVYIKFPAAQLYLTVKN
jgi:hypothetical protein